jgi:serine/threonine-protein kinase
MAVEDDDIPDAVIAVELERLAASQAFRRSPSQFRLLKYLVQQSRAGRGQRLKESVLAVEALGRSASRFDSGRDTTVRVMVRRLRQRLARYYAGEGAWAAIEIVLPLGAYQPVLRRRPQNGGAKLPSIAVLPLLNFSGNRELDVLCDGLSEEITDALARLPGVKVVARTSAFQFRGTADDVRTIGQKLGVATLLEGSVQTGRGGALKVVAQWLRAEDGYHAWSCAIEAAEGESLAAFQERVAREVVAGLQRRLLENGSLRGVPSAGTVARRSTSGAAQERYDSGRYLLRLETLDGYRRAIDVLREATVYDPDFALAHCALGRALVNLVGLTAAPANGLLTGARRSLNRALALDPDLGEAHALSGFIAWAFDREWERAERAHLRGIRCAPSLPYAHGSYAWGLMMNGRFAEADSEYRFARELDPLDLKMRTHHALVSLYAGDDRRAIGELASVLELEPGHLIARVLLATAHLWRGDGRRAEALFGELAQAHPALTIGEVGLIQVEAETGRVESARQRLARLTQQPRRTHLPPYQIAMIHARLGDAGDALHWLRRAAAQRDMNFVCAGVDRSFERLRGDPRFTRLLKRHGLRPVWAASADRC